MKTGRILFFISFCLFTTFGSFAGDKSSFLKKQFTTQNGYRLNYRVLFPYNYQPGKCYPLILFLHGAGERGNDNEAQLRHGGNMFASYENRTKFPAIIIAPQCPKEYWWVSYRRPSSTGEKRYFPPSDPITAPLGAVKELLDSYIEKGIVNKRQIYITGLSMGAIGTFDLVCRYPKLFAAAAPICGGANLERLSAFKGKTAFSIYHGEADATVDVQFSRDAYTTLKQAGAEVRYKEYPGVNHNSWDNAFAEPDFISWFWEHLLPLNP